MIEMSNVTYGSSARKGKCVDKGRGPELVSYIRFRRGDNKEWILNRMESSQLYSSSFRGKSGRLL
jgi:hypothetical protein